MSEPLLSVRNLQVAVRGNTIVEAISFDTAAASSTGLYGDSGSGKTTILHAICGLQNSAFQISGDIVFRGQSIRGLSADQRSHLGMSIVMQDLGLFEDRSVLDNIAYPLRRRKMSEQQIHMRIDEVTNVLRIPELLGRYPHQISGGQRQRVALARALVYAPELILLDEPLRGLQENLRLEFLAFLKVIANQGTAILFVTHDRTELDLVADSVIKIADGTIAQTEHREAGKPLLALGRFQTVPHPSIPSDYIKTASLRMMREGDDRKHVVGAKAIDWRILNDGRCALLAHFASGDPQWIFLEPDAFEMSQIAPGQIQLTILDQGDFS